MARVLAPVSGQHRGLAPGHASPQLVVSDLSSMVLEAYFNGWSANVTPVK